MLNLSKLEKFLFLSPQRFLSTCWQADVYGVELLRHITSAESFGNFSVMLVSCKCPLCSPLRKFLKKGTKSVAMLQGDRNSACSLGTGALQPCSADVHGGGLGFWETRGISL